MPPVSIRLLAIAHGISLIAEPIGIICCVEQILNTLSPSSIDHQTAENLQSDVYPYFVILSLFTLSWFLYILPFIKNIPILFSGNWQIPIWGKWFHIFGIMFAIIGILTIVVLTLVLPIPGVYESLSEKSIGYGIGVLQIRFWYSIVAFRWFQGK